MQKVPTLEKSTTVGFRLKMKEKLELLAVASKQGRTPNSLVATLVRRYLMEQEMENEASL